MINDLVWFDMWFNAKVYNVINKSMLGWIYGSNLRINEIFLDLQRNDLYRKIWLNTLSNVRGEKYLYGKVFGVKKCSKSSVWSKTWLLDVNPHSSTKLVLGNWHAYCSSTNLALGGRQGVLLPLVHQLGGKLAEKHPF